MKIVLNEKQIKSLLDGVTLSKEMSEEESSEDGSSSAYPEVGKWESGVTRGPANQVGNTNWSEVVGSTIKRDKANQLK